MSQSSKPPQYLSGTEAAQLLGITRAAFYRRTPPPADAFIGSTPGWKQSTIEKWDASVRKTPGPVPGSKRTPKEKK